MFQHQRQVIGVFVNNIHFYRLNISSTLSIEYEKVISKTEYSLPCKDPISLFLQRSLFFLTQDLFA